MFSYRTLIFGNGDIFGRYEWYIPSFPREILASVWWTLHAWTPLNYGTSDVYPTYFYSIWWHALLAAGGLGGGIIDRIEVLASFTVAFVGMSLFCRTITNEVQAARAAALVYAASPFLYYHTAGGHLPYMQTYALAPWLLHAASRLKIRRNLSLITLAAGFMFVPQPQGIITLAALVSGVAWSFGGTGAAVLACIISLTGSFTANAYWIVPAILAARSTLDTLAHLQPVIVDYGLKNAIVTRSLYEALRLRGYNADIFVDLSNPFINDLASHIALLVPFTALLTFVNVKSGAHKRLTLFMGFTALVSLMLFLGPTGVLTTPILFLYQHFSFMSLFKENYHFGFPFAVMLPPLFAIGLQTGSQRFQHMQSALRNSLCSSCGRGAVPIWIISPRLRNITHVLASLGVGAWALPTILSGDLSGWIAPDHITKEFALPERAFFADSSRPLMLPGVSNVHTPTRLLLEDGVDANANYDRAFGIWNPMVSAGIALLHRAHDDRLKELVDLARLSDIRYAYVREGIRTVRLLDNPYLESTVLQNAGFRAVYPDRTIPLETLRDRLQPATHLEREQIFANRIFSDRKHPITVIAPITPLADDCSPARFPDGLAARVHAGKIRLFNVTPVRFCPPSGELLTVPHPPIGISLGYNTLLYDGDMTAVRAAKKALTDGDATDFTYLQIGDYWNLPPEQRPRVIGFIGSSGSKELTTQVTCAKCRIFEPGATINAVNYNLEHWVPNGISSTWVSFFDVLDTESSFRFVATTGNEAFHWSLPCVAPTQRILAATTLSATTVIRINNSAHRFLADEHEPDTRRGMIWFDLGRAECNNGSIALTIRASRPALTVLHAVALLPITSAKLERIPTVIFALRHERHLSTVERQIPLSLPYGAFGNSVAPQMPLHDLRIDVRGHIPPPAPRTILGRTEINPAAFTAILPEKPTTKEAILELPEAWNANWLIFKAPTSLNFVGWWVCVLKRECQELPWKHIPVNGYANGWIVPPGTSGRVLIFFHPEIFFTTIEYLLVSTTLFGGACVFLIFIYRRTRTQVLR